MEKLLFISSYNFFEDNFGGGKASLRNYELLSKIFNVYYIFLSRDEKTLKQNKNSLPATKNKLHTLLTNIFGYNGYLTYTTEKKILKIIDSNKYNYIFFDTSNYGKITKKIKLKYPNIKIITFFHNIEYDFEKENYRVISNFMKIAYLFKIKASYKNEKMSTKYSDYIITLNKRDSRRLKILYEREADLELPITFKDKLDLKNMICPIQEEYILFVGSLFFANYYGIKWFIENVMPYINKTLVIIGKDFELKKLELERKNVKVIGTVKNVDEYYINATCVVMPIFNGAGMKVKTAEALMYGKLIYGTTEAFEGYEIEYEKVGGLCNTKEEFIKKLKDSNNRKFNEYSRKIFLEKYSFGCSEKIMKKFIDKEKSKVIKLK